MLYLNPPYYVIDGVSVFPDHADPLQFYYLPMMPHLSTARDAAGVDIPVLQLIEYEGSAGTGGFINFDVNIGIADQARESVASKLRQQAKLADMPRLSPVTFVDGSVRLLILGAESTDPQAKPAAPAAAATPAAGPRFVIKVQNAAKPSLFGDNQASFSVQLDQYGATILAQALRGDMAPIAVIYDLDFLALRPAFKVQLHVDWDRVQSYLDKQFSGGFLFVSDQIDKAVESLIESQAITINIDSFVTEDDPSAHGADADRDRAVSECYDMIKSTFFQASLPPPDPNQPDGWDKALGTYKAVSAIAMTGGAASLASFSYKQTDLKRTDRKRLDVTMTERTSVLRTIYPQGHLSGLLSAAQKSGVSFDRFIMRVKLDDPWFTRRALRVVTHADFAADSIASIDVNMTYGGRVQSVTLTAPGTFSAVDWSSVLKDGEQQRQVSYSFTVNFQSVDSAQRPAQLTSPACDEISDVLSIDPSKLYSITTVPLSATGLPWDRYPAVTVDCRYVDAGNAIDLQISATLNSATPVLNWLLFMRDTSRRAFNYRLTYTMVTGGTHVAPWITTDDGKVTVADPFPDKMKITILPALDWSQVEQALVYLAYPNRDTPTSQQTIIFTQAASTAQSFIVERQSASQTLLYFEVRLVKKNGSVWTVPGSFTADRLLIVQDGMKGRQIVQVSPEQIDFASRHITGVTVQMRYADPAHALAADAALSMTVSSDTRSFAYDYVDPAIVPEWRADVELDNGQTRSFDWAPVSGGALVVPLSTLD